MTKKELIKKLHNNLENLSDTCFLLGNETTKHDLTAEELDEVREEAFSYFDNIMTLFIDNCLPDEAWTGWWVDE